MERNNVTRNREYVFYSKIGKVCSFCNESNPLVLEYDHIDPTQKKYSIQKLIKSGYGIRTIDSELAKCRLVCSNCHQMISQVQQKAFSLDYLAIFIWKWVMLLVQWNPVLSYRVLAHGA